MFELSTSGTGDLNFSWNELETLSGGNPSSCAKLFSIPSPSSMPSTDRFHSRICVPGEDESERGMDCTSESASRVGFVGVLRVSSSPSAAGSRVRRVLPFRVSASAERGRSLLLLDRTTRGRGFSNRSRLCLSQESRRIVLFAPCVGVTERFRVSVGVSLRVEVGGGDVDCGYVPSRDVGELGSGLFGRAEVRCCIYGTRADQLQIRE